MEDTFERRLVKKSVKERLGKGNRQNKVTDLRIKILSSPKGAPARIDARKILAQRRSIRRNKNIRGLATSQSTIPFLIPRRTVSNEYFTGSRMSPTLAKQSSNVRIPQQQPLVRTVRNLGSADSTISPIQGYRVEVKNLLRSVTIDDVYELFAGVGALRSCNFVQPAVAHVIFNSAKDAQLAVARYNNRELDGKPMNVTLLTPLPPSSALQPSSLQSSEGLITQKRKPGNAVANVSSEVINRGLHNDGSNSGRPVVFHVNL
nr:polymerase delta interacting protein 3 [Hymenolepis microstoma]